MGSILSAAEAGLGMMQC